jgi:hypothetical protein
MSFSATRNGLDAARNRLQVPSSISDLPDRLKIRYQSVVQIDIITLESNED